MDNPIKMDDLEVPPWLRKPPQIADSSSKSLVLYHLYPSVLVKTLFSDRCSNNDLMSDARHGDSLVHWHTNWTLGHVPLFWTRKKILAFWFKLEGWTKLPNCLCIFFYWKSVCNIFDPFNLSENALSCGLGIFDPDQLRRKWSWAAIRRFARSF